MSWLVFSDQVAIFKKFAFVMLNRNMAYLLKPFWHACLVLLDSAFSNILLKVFHKGYMIFEVLISDGLALGNLMSLDTSSSMGCICVLTLDTMWRAQIHSLNRTGTGIKSYETHDHPWTKELFFQFFAFITIA